MNIASAAQEKYRRAGTVATPTNPCGTSGSAVAERLNRRYSGGRGRIIRFL